MRRILMGFAFLVGAVGVEGDVRAQVLVSAGNAPAGQPTGSDHMQVSSRRDHSVALRTDGTLLAWGSNADGQCSPPPLPTGLVYTKVAAGNAHTVALRSDRAVVAFGRNDRGQCTPPSLPPGVGWIDVDAGSDWTIGLGSDGRVRLWGSYAVGSLYPVPVLADCVAVCAGFNHALALRSNGSIVAWGNNYDGQTIVPPLPPGMTYTAIAAGATFSAAVRSDGQLVRWGVVWGILHDLPPLTAGQRWVAVAAGPWQFAAWRNDGAVFAVGSSWYWLTPPPPNHRYVGVAWAENHLHWLAAPDVAATYSSLGPGCAGSAGASQITAEQRPALGTTFTCEVGNVPQGVAVLLSGLDATSSSFGPLPIDLSVIGMTGCIARVRTDATQVAVAANGVAAFSLALPWSTRLLGLSFYQQALLPDAGANPAGLVLSEAKAATIGF